MQAGEHNRHMKMLFVKMGPPNSARALQERAHRYHQLMKNLCESSVDSYGTYAGCSSLSSCFEARAFGLPKIDSTMIAS